MTIKYMRKAILFTLLSVLSWLGLCGALVMVGLKRGFSGGDSISAQLVSIFLPLAITYILAIALFIFIKEKLRNTVWIANVVLSALLLGNTMLWISLILFAADEFVLRPLSKHFRNKYAINKEIDKRS